MIETGLHVHDDAQVVAYPNPLACRVLSPDRLVAVRVAYAELEVSRQVKEAGGSWNRG